MTISISRGVAACVALAGLVALPQRAAADVSESRYHEASSSASVSLADRAEAGAAVSLPASAAKTVASRAGESAIPMGLNTIVSSKTDPSPTPNPEPATILLIGAGTAGAALWRRRGGLISAWPAFLRLPKDRTGPERARRA